MPAPDFLPLPRVSHPKPPAQTDGLPTLPGPWVFRPSGGPLADTTSQPGEQVAIMELFAGSIGAFKNPSSHRTVHFDDPVEAVEVIQLADLLLRLLARTQDRT